MNVDGMGGEMAVKRGYKGDNVIYRNAAGESMAVILTGGQGDAPPIAPVGVGSGTGGTLPAASYVYKYTAVVDGLESAPSAVSNTVVTTGSTSSIAVTVTAVTGATSYKVYGRTGGNFKLLATLTAPTVLYTDTNADTPGVDAPTADFRVAFRTPYTGHAVVTGVVPGLGASQYQKI